jgi:Na+/H+-dicarboxylate symporter
MMLTLLLASKGVAAVPRASLVVLASTCAAYGLKVEWIATILGVDAVMDMARTMVNVLGNCMASIIVGQVGTRDSPRRPAVQRTAARILGTRRRRVLESPLVPFVTVSPCAK